jgi:metal transporter CNNM
MAAARRNGLALSMLLVRVALGASPYGIPKPPLPSGNTGTERGSREFWYHLTVSIMLVLAGGVFAG